MDQTNSNVVHSFKIADASASVRHVFIRDMVLTSLIGVHKHERKQPQRVRINLDLAVSEGQRLRSDELEDVLCYEDVADGIRGLIAKGHVNLVETLAENIADLCLADARVQTARVRVEKLDVFEDAASAGVEIERHRPV
ncbi:MAG: dihydroneopterin aldolase, partial [Rhodospirillales bacterium]|nr:dihydroneopterin aldolase [Rhodospirillales bacterium]